MSYRRATVTAFGGPEVMRVTDEPSVPEPGPGEVRLAVEAATASYTDTMVRKGIYPPLLLERPPITPGYDVVGRVAERGAGVTELAVGQRVAGLVQTGGHAEQLCLPPRWRRCPARSTRRRQRRSCWPG
ncbi:MAG: hypothetical protein BRD47_01930 [Bacteroidetes bacterium QS_8_68_28]|nr:MAG: hypothetical protein BRD47_01930 [Bacteroidetes bacterium QS_8_68_28]